MNSNEILVVSLGAGDPQQVTIKALRALERADVIFCPYTIMGQKRLSRSEAILESLEIDSKKIESYHLPMSKERGATIEVYKGVAAKCIELYKKGLTIAITAEGDGGFYSSSQYISEIVAQSGIAVRRISGVPAFIECAALAGMHVVSADKSLVVIPLLESAAKAKELLDAGSNIVFMKLTQSQEAIKELLAECGDSAKFHYIENCGVKGKEYYSSDTQTILARKFPYFSILIVESK